MQPPPAPNPTHPNSSTGLRTDEEGRTTVAGLIAGSVFGPVHSRRFGLSLGINPLPANRKVCSFDCLYCECGRTSHPHRGPGDEAQWEWPAAGEILDRVESMLRDHLQKGTPIETLTFAGNGEPTLHPDFRSLALGAVELCRRYSPAPKTVVLTNGTEIGRAEVEEGLRAVDEACFKLDAGTVQMNRNLNHPMGDFLLEELVSGLSLFPNPVIQALFVQGSVDNTTEAEVEAWIDLLGRIRPVRVDVYSLDRPAPDPAIERVDRSDLERIAERVRSRLSLPVRVY